MCNVLGTGPGATCELTLDTIVENLQCVLVVVSK